MLLETASKQAIACAAQVRMLIFDVDGVMTDGSLHFTQDGEYIKTFNALDGQGIKLLQQFGIGTAIISARSSAMVARRAHDLGFDHVYQGVHDKYAAFEQLLQASKLKAEACGFVGDDIIDLPILTRVGFAASVTNGHIEVKRRVHYVSQARGGHGAIREICDFILQAQGHYDAALASYLHE